MDRLDELLAADGGVLTLRDRPALASTIGRASRSGRLTTVFPGVYVDSAHATDPDVLELAALRRFPDAVLRLQSAARHTFWPRVTPPAVQVAGVRPRHRTPGFDFTGRRLPPEWVMQRGSLRLSSPEYTAMELAQATDGASIDELLRSRMGTVAGLRRAHNAMTGSAGQQIRGRLLLESRDDAWSAAERLAHKILRAAGIGGWHGNYRLLLRNRTLFLDICFPRLKLVIEIDGRAYHLQSDAFETERERQNLLMLEGWIILRFTWTMLTADAAYVVRTTEEAIAIRHPN